MVGTIITSVLEKLAETWIGSWVASFFGIKKAAAPDTGERAAKAETELAEEQTANEIVDQAAAVRTGADARVLLESGQAPAKGSSAVPAGTGTGLDVDPEGHWRD